MLPRPLLTSVGSLSDIDGVGMIIDEDGLIMYHPDSSRIMTQHIGNTKSEPGFFVDTSNEDEGEFVYYHPIEGKSWSVIITVPGGYAQQQAVSIALPLLGIITILSNNIAIRFISRQFTAEFKLHQNRAAAL